MYSLFYHWKILCMNVIVVVLFIKNAFLICMATLSSAVQSKKNPGLPNGPSIVDGWVVRVTFGSSVCDVATPHKNIVMGCWVWSMSCFLITGLHFPIYMQLTNSEKSFRNPLVTKLTIVGETMGPPFRLWVSFGDHGVVFGLHWL